MRRRSGVKVKSLNGNSLPVTFRPSAVLSASASLAWSNAGAFAWVSASTSRNSWPAGTVLRYTSFWVSWHPPCLVGEASREVLVPIAQRHRPLIVGERPLGRSFNRKARQAGNDKSSERSRLSHSPSAVIAGDYHM